MPDQLTYGGVPVPYTVAWTAELEQRVDRCPHAKMRALCMVEARGEGKPQFGKPHAQRQREVIARELCDLCGKPLALRTKVSLSHARPRVGANGLCIMQVEPLLHRECAAESMEHCPSLKRDIRGEGWLCIRQVLRFHVEFALMSPTFINHYVPSYERHPRDKIVGHAKVVLERWKDRDMAWLTREPD